MTEVVPLLMAAQHARDAAYDLVLLAHGLSALIGIGAVVVAGLCALALIRSGPSSEALARYYRPGVNWAGRVLFLVPVSGVALIAMSHGDWSYSDGWVSTGLVTWAFVAVVAEMALWPAERRLQVAVGDPSSAEVLRSQCLGVVVTAAVLFAMLVVAVVVMVSKS
jgi:hypothetical protein